MFLYSLVWNTFYFNVWNGTDTRYKIRVKINIFPCCWTIAEHLRHTSITDPENKISLKLAYSINSLSFKKRTCNLFNKLLPFKKALVEKGFYSNCPLSYIRLSESHDFDSLSAWWYYDSPKKSLRIFLDLWHRLQCGLVIIKSLSKTIFLPKKMKKALVIPFCW